jgi:hypothetical protein
MLALQASLPAPNLPIATRLHGLLAALAAPRFIHERLRRELGTGADARTEPEKERQHVP